MAALSSPIILICAEQVVERWTRACIHEAVELSMIHPNDGDTYSRDAGGNHRISKITSLRQQSPSLIRNLIRRLLTGLGWGQPLGPAKDGREPSNEPTQSLESNDEQILGVGGTRIIDLTALALPLAQTSDLPLPELSSMDVITTPIDRIDDMVRPTTPPTPTASTPGQEDNDPRIRITSREGIVEMEVRLPPRILSSHTEAALAPTSSPNRRATDQRNMINPPSTSSRPYHRISQLSSEPTHMIGAVVKAQLVGIAMLPIRVVVLRAVAAHFLANHERCMGRLRVARLLPSLSDMTWRSIGIQISRVALCGMLELTIDLGLWGLQYLAITRIGQRIFGWGTF